LEKQKRKAMNTSRLFGAMCACLITCYSASSTAMDGVVNIATNRDHEIIVDNIAPRELSNTSGVENIVFVISAGLIGFFLLRKANNG
jgi:hypothetical protein